MHQRMRLRPRLKRRLPRLLRLQRRKPPEPPEPPLLLVLLLLRLLVRQLELFSVQHVVRPTI